MIDNLYPPKIAFIIKEKFLHGAIIDLVNKLISISAGKLYIEENISNQDIELINSNFDAVYTRHSLEPSIQRKINIIIFSQHECPLNVLDKLSDKYIYLTDLSYKPLFPIAEEHIHSPIHLETLAKYKKYDVVLIGTQRLTYRLKLTPQFIIANLNINNFNSMLSIMPDSRFLSFLDKLNILDRTKIYRFYWQVNQAIRNLRRQRIIGELANLADHGKKIAVIGNIGYSIKNSRIYFLGEHLEWEDIRKIIRESRIIICTTPMHQSILNERFTTAIEENSIALCEPYPQYLSLLTNFREKYCFDYKKGSLFSKVTAIINDWDEELIQYQNVRKEVSQELSDLKIQEKFRRLIEKYSPCK